MKLMMIIQGTIELRYNIRSAWFLDIRISTCTIKMTEGLCELSRKKQHHFSIE